MKILFIIATLFALSAPAFGKMRHPHLMHARMATMRAVKQLRAANDREPGKFGGHRDKAIMHLKAAQQEIKLAFQYANSHAKKPAHRK